MKTRGMILAAGALLSLSTAAMAQFTATNPGPLESNGPAGDPLNGAFSFNYAGPAFQIGTISFSGMLTQSNLNTWASEARWRITNPAGQFMDAQVSTTNGFAGTIDIASNIFTSSPFNAAASSVGMWQFQAFESYDDGGDLLADSIWNNLSFTFNVYTPPVPPTSINLGTYAPGTFSVDSNGSGFDTELGVYNAEGVLLGNDDDGGDGAQSLVNLGDLADGTYYVALGGYNTTFGEGWTVSGGAGAGDYLLNVNGAQALAGTTVANEVVWASFTVAVPTPGTMALLGFGGLVAARRRR